LSYRKEPIQLGAPFREAYPNVLLIINRPWHNSSIHLLLWDAKRGSLNHKTSLPPAAEKTRDAPLELLLPSR